MTDTSGPVRLQNRCRYVFPPVSRVRNNGREEGDSEQT